MKTIIFRAKPHPFTMIAADLDCEKNIKIQPSYPVQRRDNRSWN